LKDNLSSAEARRVALAALGFAHKRPEGVVSQAHLRRVIERLALHQIDSVNVLVRAHYLPLFSRLGAYPRALLDEAAWGPKSKRRLFEYWAHEASLLPLDVQPLLRWRMDRAARGIGVWTNVKPFAAERRAEADALLKRISDHGPVAASDVAETRGQGGWWGWSETKQALEYLFWSGQITTATRRTSFERVYDLPERVLPRVILDAPTPVEADAQRALIARGARALGVATASDLRDYFRLKPADALPRIAELVEDGTLRKVAVRGWSQPAYLHAEAKMPRRIEGQALLAPFDPLIWERARTERIFGTRYRIEIYVPAEKRVHGYYVLPFLVDGQIVARVDLKADRQAGTLLLQRAHREEGAPADMPERLMAELALMAGWLGLGSVTVAGKTDF
jgi:uncharacterized protein YcaQ